MRTTLLRLLAFYQRFLSLLGRGGCRFYPTCSEYARWEFTHDTIPRALIKTTLRIGRCNPLFDGGIDYPVVLFPPPALLGPPRQKTLPSIRYWFIPRSADRAVVIHSLNDRSF